MDPKANITEQLDIAHRILNTEAEDTVCSRLAELVIALDEWRRKGGFDPYA